MVIAIVVAVLGLGAIALGGLQLCGVVPVVRRRAGTFPAYMNVLTGLFLIALAALRLKGLL